MQKNCLYTYFLKYRIVWKWACSNTLNYHLIHVRDCTKTSKLKSITELKSAEKQRSESMKGNMEFQRHIELINCTSSNESLQNLSNIVMIKKWQEYIWEDDDIAASIMRCKYWKHVRGYSELYQISGYFRRCQTTTNWKIFNMTSLFARRFLFVPSFLFEIFHHLLHDGSLIYFSIRL